MKKRLFNITLTFIGLLLVSTQSQAKDKYMVLKERVLVGHDYNMTMPGYMPVRPVYKTVVTRIKIKENSITDKPKPVRNIPSMGGRF